MKTAITNDTNYIVLTRAIAEIAENDEQFLQDLLVTDSVEEVRDLLAVNGIDVTPEDVNVMLEIGRNAIVAAAQECELSEDDLEAVAGGGRVRGALRQVATYAGVAAIGLAMVGACAVAPEGAPAWIAIGKTAMIAAGVAGTAWTLKGYAK